MSLQSYKTLKNTTITSVVMTLLSVLVYWQVAESPQPDFVLGFLIIPLILMVLFSIVCLRGKPLADPTSTNH